MLEQKEIEQTLAGAEKTHTLLQYVVVVLLGLVLCTLIGGYIYLGMERAKKAGEVPPPDVAADTEVTGELTAEERQAILNALSADLEESQLTPEERQAILDSLNTSAVEGEETELSPDERRQILDSLQYNKIIFMTITFRKLSGFVFLGIITFLFYASVGLAWTAPTTNPPNGNVAAPVNVGTSSASRQDVRGTIGVDTLFGFKSIGLLFTNTAGGNTPSRWIVQANDGTGNFTQYINTDGGANPVRLSAGYAWREVYDPSLGNYTYLTSSSTGVTGSPITWKPSLRILGDGRVGADQYCDINGGNCISTSELVRTTDTGGGNEVVYLNAPQQIYGPNSFRSGNDVRLSYNLLSGSFPSNIIRAYITVSGRGYDGADWCTGGSNGNCYSAPGFSPWVSYYPVFATGPTAIANFYGTLERKGDWIMVKDDVIDFIANCGSTNCGNSGTFNIGGWNTREHPTLSIEIAGYECAGACDSGGVAARCDLSLSWNINGKTGNAVRTVYGQGQLAIGMNYDKDDWEWYPHVWPLYSENLDSHSWGGSFSDSGERAMVGYFDQRNYQRNEATLTSYNAAGHIVIAPITMANGQTRTITNEAVSEIPAGTVRLTGTMSNCIQ
jgi:hypothetical protein